MSGDHAHAPKKPAQPQPSRSVGGTITVVSEPVGERWFVFRVGGEIDMVTAPRLAIEVARAFGPARAVQGRVVVFDLTETTFLASSGLAVLADADNEVKRRSMPPVRLVVTARAVRRPLEVTGLDTVFEMYDDLNAALDQ